MNESYRIRLSKDTLVFSAAHFITFAGNFCERLHGHNYRVEAELEGPLDENHYVVDFIACRDALQRFVSALDHRMLLPTQHPQIHVDVSGDEVTARFEDRRWVFPHGDCALLPVPNTTTELLARYLGTQLMDWLGEAQQVQSYRLRIAVDENFGQWGEWISDRHSNGSIRAF